MAESDYSAEHKVPEFSIQELTNESPEFYPLLGPLLANREVVAELGAPVWDDAGKVWFVARAKGSGDLIGMVATLNRSVCSLYVLPGNRGLLVGYALLQIAVSRAGVAPLRATATSASKPLFERLGFAETGTRGKFFVMKREVVDE
jgi:GNAT superfamily N-acetyltransferase